MGSISVSQSAMKELKRSGIGGETFLRISVIQGGCSGLTYQVISDDVQTAFDQPIYEQDEIRVLTDRSSFPLLKGLSIDYSDDLVGMGFQFLNPNAATACGCGGSFTA